MKVFFVRHGQAKDEKEDPKRPLSDRGKFDVMKVASLTAASGMVDIEKIFHSEKLRAKQTAEIFAVSFGLKEKMYLMEHITPNDPIDECLSAIEEERVNIMIVGHLPHLDKTVSAMLCGDQNKKLTAFCNSGIICLEKRVDGTWAIAPLLP